jgi:hypothetical protein
MASLSSLSLASSTTECADSMTVETAFECNGDANHTLDIPVPLAADGNDGNGEGKKGGGGEDPVPSAADGNDGNGEGKKGADGEDPVPSAADGNDGNGEGNKGGDGDDVEKPKTSVTPAAHTLQTGPQTPPLVGQPHPPTPPLIGQPHPPTPPMTVRPPPVSVDINRLTRNPEEITCSYVNLRVYKMWEVMRLRFL